MTLLRADLAQDDRKLLPSGEGNKRTAESFNGWRIFCSVVPYQIADVKVEKTDFSKEVVPGETVIWDADKGLEVGDDRSVTFTARRMKD